MKFQSLFLFAASLSGALANPLPLLQNKPPYFILTGDSTVAVKGGWGDGFLSFLKAPAAGQNPAKGGATTVSFRAEGRWDAVLKTVEEKVKTGDYSDVVVTIQFGHNDQKADKGISKEAFRKNLEVMIGEVKSRGGSPIIITSLTRRTFKNGAVNENLAEHSQLAIDAAKAKGVQYLNLNRKSTDYINAVGQANADTYNLAEGDRTHLNKGGERLFGRMVVDLLLEKKKGWTSWFEKRGVLSEKIDKGQYATGKE